MHKKIYIWILVVCMLMLALYVFRARNLKGDTSAPIVQVYPLPELVQDKAADVVQKVRVPILMYHHIGELPADADAITRDLTVPNQGFDSQVGWLRSEGYESVTLQQVYLATQGNFNLPAKPVVFTFDDGYSDAFNNAIPILQKYGYTGSFAVITQYLGKEGYASVQQLQAASTQGMEIVSHTRDHFDGANTLLSAQSIYDNLQGSRDDLKALGIETQVLVYPFGHYTKEYMAAAEKAGFVMGVTVKYGAEIDPDHLMETPRVRVHGESNLDTFKKNLLK